MSEETTTKIGGPTFFVQAPDGLWGQFRTPDGHDVTPHERIDISECEFMGMLYREVRPPPRELKEADRSAWEAAYDAFNEVLERDDVEMTLAATETGMPTFVTLVPLNDDGT